MVLYRQLFGMSLLIPARVPDTLIGYNPTIIAQQFKNHYGATMAIFIVCPP